MRARLTAPPLCMQDAHRDRWVAAVTSRYGNFRDKRLAEGALACEQMLSAAQNRLMQVCTPAAVALTSICRLRSADKSTSSAVSLCPLHLYAHHGVFL